MQNTSRRHFLKTAGMVTAGATLGFQRMAHATGQERTIRVGLVGCGGRGRGAAYNALHNSGYPNVKLTAIADAFQYAVDGTAKLFSEQYADKTDLPAERQFVGLDCCERLVETDVDVVLLCEPPGFRPRHCLTAIEAGKHVFAEKPVATDAPGVRIFRDAAAKAETGGKCFLVGHHLRFEKKHTEPIEMIHAGEIGELKYMRIFFNTGYLWTRPRREGQTEMEHQVSNWYYFNWLSGDHIVEQHVHDIDVMNWMAGDKTPLSANGTGGRQVRIGRDFGEIFDHHSVEYTYENEVRGFSVCRQINNCWGAFSEHAYGTKGHVDMDGHGMVWLHREGKDTIQWRRDSRTGHQVEMDVLFDAVANGKNLNTGNYAADATMTAILGRMATYSGRVVSWNDGANSELDLFPKTLAWDADPGPKPAADGIYPCAMPGISKAW